MQEAMKLTFRWRPFYSVCEQQPKLRKASTHHIQTHNKKIQQVVTDAWQQLLPHHPGQLQANHTLRHRRTAHKLQLCPYLCCYLSFLKKA